MRPPTLVCCNCPEEAETKMSNREMSDQMADYDERQLVDELDREVEQRGSLFALLACLAIGAGLAMSVVLALSAG